MVPQGLADREVTVHDVILRHEAHHGRVAVQAGLQILITVRNHSRGRRCLSGGQTHQGALAGATGSGNGRNSSWGETHGDLVEEPLVGLPHVESYPSHGYINTRDFWQGFQHGHANTSGEGTHLDNVAGVEPLASLYSGSVDIRTGDRGLVLDPYLAGHIRVDNCVQGANHRVIENHVSRSGCPNSQRRTRHRQRATQLTHSQALRRWSLRSDGDKGPSGIGQPNGLPGGHHAVNDATAIYGNDARR